MNPSGIEKDSPTGSVRMRLAIALGIALGAAGLALVSSIPTDAGARTERRITLGSARNDLKPNCGTDFSRDCVVEGKVTAYQTKRADAPRRRLPFSVPWAGKIVSWSIALARPTKREIDDGGTTRPAQAPFFNDVFGSPAQAGISVLRPLKVSKSKPPKWKMVRQSPIETLNPYFGTRVHFVLEKPLNVIRNQVIGLTIPTWAPALWKPRACNFNAVSGTLDPGKCDAAEANYTWRASRGRGKCRLGVDSDTGEPNAALRDSRPQRKVGSNRQYACRYGSNALLYTVTIVGRN